MKSIITISFLLLAIVACEDRFEVIKGCCEEPAIKSRVGLGEIYIPNVITPNGDQINDVLIIQGDSIQEIQFVQIKNSDGVPVYKAKNIPVNAWYESWDGKVNGQVVRGLYSIEVHAESIDGYLKKLNGHVCVCPCDMEVDEDMIPIKNCEFGSEYHPDGIGEPGKEPLHCFDNN